MLRVYMMNKNKFCETLHGPLNKEMTEKINMKTMSWTREA